MPEKKSTIKAAGQGRDAGAEGSAEAAGSGEGKKGPVIYLGPAIAGVVSPGTVFRNGLPAPLQAAVAENPSLNMLLVDVKHTAKARKELRIRTSARTVCYEKVLREMKGENK